jgi:hypothetical protein
MAAVKNVEFVFHHSGQIEAVPTGEPTLWFVATGKEGQSVDVFFRKDGKGNIFIQDGNGNILTTLNASVSIKSFNCDAAHPYPVRRIWLHGHPQCRSTNSCGGCMRLPIPFVAIYSCMHDFCCISPVDLITNAVPQEYP